MQCALLSAEKKRRRYKRLPMMIKSHLRPAVSSLVLLCVLLFILLTDYTLLDCRVGYCKFDIWAIKSTIIKHYYTDWKSYKGKCLFFYMFQMFSLWLTIIKKEWSFPEVTVSRDEEENRFVYILCGWVIHFRHKMAVPYATWNRWSQKTRIIKINDKKNTNL